VKSDGSGIRCKTYITLISLGSILGAGKKPCQSLNKVALLVLQYDVRIMVESREPGDSWWTSRSGSVLVPLNRKVWPGSVEIGLWVSGQGRVGENSKRLAVGDSLFRAGSTYWRLAPR
jgi:hypothetical protein